MVYFIFIFNRTFSSAIKSLLFSMLATKTEYITLIFGLGRYSSFFKSLLIVSNNKWFIIPQIYMRKAKQNKM